MLIKTRTTIIALIASASFAATSAAPAISQADQKGSAPAPVTCSGGGKPGDISEVKVVTSVNGKVVTTQTFKTICGSDGQWHSVVNVVRRPVTAPIAIPVSEAGNALR